MNSARTSFASAMSDGPEYAADIGGVYELTVTWSSPDAAPFNRLQSGDLLEVWDHRYRVTSEIERTDMGVRLLMVDD